LGEYHKLLELQQIELKLERLQKELKELPVFAEFKKLQVQSADAKEALGWADGKLQEHKKRTRRLERQLQAAEEEHKVNQAQLYSTSGQTAKELEQLERKAESLLSEWQSQEEAMLLAMQGTEDLEAALAKAKDEGKILQKKLKAKQKTGNEEIEQMKKEILAYREQRDQILQKLAKPLADEYKELRKRFHGRPVAMLEGDICGGCRVSVSSNTRAQLNNPNCKASCDNCGRILIPLNNQE
jgi:predicted  nucleic acid-binding Zn-ribbon protein